ncbi:uncharacterized protein LOC131858447 [Cryptomeria japonica]|uniref:uncharacterized protein LOC131858447 n=1 Tax=Cryptomeria japonica TaxID=3369 RepID=UPI0027D9E89D|nr:uncharacterized protein LOC131858447 [Cryptomeria japonica]
MELRRRFGQNLNGDGLRLTLTGLQGACDDEGKVLFEGAKRLQDGTNNNAEVQAAMLATDLAVNMKVEKVHLEGDSQVVVNAIMKGVTPNWRLNKFITLICSKLKTFQDFCISHVRRSGNVIADRLSNVACNLAKGEMRWWDGNDSIIQWS